MATTYTYTNSFSILGVGINGATVNAYKASRFVSPPALNSAAPGGGADATTTTAVTAGFSGAFAIALPTSEDYYLSVSFAANVYWLGPVYGIFADTSVQGGSSRGNLATGPGLMASYAISVTSPGYNADPTGVVDATGAFANAMNDAVTTGVGTVYVPPGTYTVNNAVSLKQATGYLRVVGASEGSVTLQASSTTFSVLQLNMPGEVTDMTLSGGPANRTDTGVTVTGGSNVVLDPSITAADTGRVILSPTLFTANSICVGTVTPGVSFQASTSASSQANVGGAANALTNGSSITLGPYNTTPLYMRAPKVAGVYVPITRFAVRRVTCTNIAGGPNNNWLLNMGDPGAFALPLVDEMILDDVTLTGPSCAGQDAMTVTYGRRCAIRNLRLVGLSRSPNIFGPLSTKIDSATVELTSANQAGNSVFVVAATPSNFGLLTTQVASLAQSAAPPIWRKNRAVTASPQAFVQPTAAATGTTGNSVGLYWVCTTPGTTGSTEPSWPASPTNGTTQSDGTAVWTWNTGQTVSLVTSFPITGDTSYPSNPFPSGALVALPSGAALNMGTNGGANATAFTGWTSSGGIAGTIQNPNLTAASAAGATSVPVNFYPVDGGFAVSTLAQVFMLTTQELNNVEVVDRQFAETGVVSAIGHPDIEGDFVTISNMKLPGNGIGYLNLNAFNFGTTQQVRITNSQLESGIDVNNNCVLDISNCHVGTKLNGGLHNCIQADGGVSLVLNSTNVEYDGGTNGTNATSEILRNGSSASSITGRMRGGSIANAISPPFTAAGGTMSVDVKDVGPLPYVVPVSSNAGTVPITATVANFTNSSATTMAVTIATASAVDGQSLTVRVYDFSAAAQTIGWTGTENGGASVPTTSNGSTTLPLTVGFVYNGSTSKWRCVAVA